MPVPRVWLLSTGGTIAGKGASSMSFTDYEGSCLEGAELLATVPEVARYADVSVRQVANVGSPDVTPDLWRNFAQTIEVIYSRDPGVSGIVVSHGTATLEETAYFLHLTVRDERPVVITGAQRPSTALSADGPLNLVNAVRVAVAPEARGKGVLVVMNEEINGARDVTKSNTYRVETFRSGELGLLGYVDDDRVSFYKASTRRHTITSEFSVRDIKVFPRVEIIYSYAQSSMAPIRALLNEGVDGIVFAAPGAGSLSEAELHVVREIASVASAKRTVLIRASRTGNGRVAGRAKYDNFGTIPADNLNPQKARILLMLALARTRDPREIARVFSEY